jgi:Ca2+-binding RTX toxin-like protein
LRVVFNTKLGTAGIDVIVGSTIDDLIFAFAGNDSVRGGLGNDYLYGGDGNDTVFGDAGNDRVDGEIGDDTLYGGDGNDIIFAGVGNDRLYGDAGDDQFSANAGNDLLFGGAGNDQLKGNEDADTIYGGIGNDTLYGGTGNDTLMGDLGRDTLIGGIGNDRIVLQYNQGADIVQSFENHGVDRLNLSAKVFHLTSVAGGALKTTEYLVSTDHVATSATQRIIYESDTHQLWADGNGKAYAPVLIADTLYAPAGGFVAADFLIIA